MANAGYKIGQFIGGYFKDAPALTSIALIGVLILVFSSCSKSTEISTTDAISTAGSGSAVAYRPSIEEKCRSDRPALLAKYDQDIKDGLPWSAATSLRRCAGLLNDGELLKKVSDAELADRIKTANNKNAPLFDRLTAIEQIEDMDPVKAKELAQTKAKVTQALAKEDERNRKAVAASKRSQGVSIGMSQEDVLASSWGKPRKVNKSIYSFGVHEQWVYNGGYLYFKNGVLDSIQTGN